MGTFRPILLLWIFFLLNEIPGLVPTICPYPSWSQLCTKNKQKNQHTYLFQESWVWAGDVSSPLCSFVLFWWLLIATSQNYMALISTEFSEVGEGWTRDWGKALMLWAQRKWTEWGWVSLNLEEVPCWIGEYVWDSIGDLVSIVARAINF